MAKITDEEVLKATEELYKQIAAETSPSRKENCKFFGRHTDRFCIATTHKTCSRCKMFEPTIFAKFRTLLKDNMRLRQEVGDLTAEREELTLRVKILEECLEGEPEKEYLMEEGE